MDGNNLWKNNINIGNTIYGGYIYPKCELVTMDNMNRLRVFDSIDGDQKMPPSIEWVNFTMRDFSVVRESDKINILSNRRVMIVDADHDYRIYQYRNTTVDPAGKHYRYHLNNDRNEYVVMFEDEVLSRNFRMQSITGDQDEICHHNCHEHCTFPLQWCAVQDGLFNEWLDCSNCTECRWYCRMSNNVKGLLFALLLGLIGLGILLCLCCCYGNGTRVVHTNQNYNNRNSFDEDDIEEKNMVEIVEEIVEDEAPKPQPRTYVSNFNED